MYFFKYLSFVKIYIPINNQKANTLRRNFTAQMFYKQMLKTNIKYSNLAKPVLCKTTRTAYFKISKPYPLLVEAETLPMGALSH